MDAQNKSVNTTFEDANVLVCPAAPGELSLTEEKGLYSESYGVRQPRRAFAYRHRSPAPATFATLLLPYRGSQFPSCRVELPRQHRAGDARVELNISAFGKDWRIGRDLKLAAAWCERS